MTAGRQGLKGATLHRGRWRATIFRDGKHHHLGYFPSELDAHRAYVEFAAAHPQKSTKLRPERLTQELLKQQLAYDPETGIFTSRIGVPRRRAGTVTGSVKKNGYVRISVFCQGYSAHRLAWLYMTGEWPAEHIDHINGARSDNRWLNLRKASCAQNQYNRVKRNKNNKSGFRGVYFAESKNLWCAAIRDGGKSVYLGGFDTAEQAHAAYDAAAKKLHGEFYRSVNTAEAA